MAFDQAKFDLIEASIKRTVDTLAVTAEGAFPAYTPAIIIGQAVLDASPELYAVVAKAIEGKLPTDAERSQVAKEIHDLLTAPENI